MGLAIGRALDERIGISTTTFMQISGPVVSPDDFYANGSHMNPAEGRALAGLLDRLDREFMPLASFFATRPKSFDLTPRIETVHGSEVFNDFWRPLAVERQLIGVLGTASVPRGFVCAARAEKESPFTARDLHELEGIRARIDRSLATRRQLGSGTLENTLAVLARATPAAWFLFDSAGKLLWLTDEASGRLSRDALRVGSSIMLRHSSALEELQTWVRGSARGRSRGAARCPGDCPISAPGEEFTMRRYEMSPGRPLFLVGFANQASAGLRDAGEKASVGIRETMLGERAGQATLGLRSGNAVSEVTPGSDPAGQLRVGEILARRFMVLRLIARGGMGAVYEANDAILRAPVALKVLERQITPDEAARERFRREVLLARRVSHSSVCRVHEFYEATAANGTRVAFLTMEFLNGETLAARIRRTGRLTTDEALPLVQQMCDGLAAAHAQGVIHRDFKSANVILVPSSLETLHEPARAVITDFGIARALDQRGRPGEEAITGGASIVGTPAYMAPEQVTGSKTSQATDLYALGVVMYEMVTGHLPFAGDTALATAVSHVEQAPPRPESLVPGLDPRWSRAILRLLDRDPGRRFQDAGKVAAALIESRTRRYWLVLAALAGALLLAIGSGLVARAC
jgi:tRNA A-37 threonylcarbamoyl transferase component Bud32